MVHLYQMTISPGVFFNLFKILIFHVIRGVKRQKMAQNDKKISLFCSTLIKKLTNINRCLTDPADQCLTDISQYYMLYSTYPVLVILN